MAKKVLSILSLVLAVAQGKSFLSFYGSKVAPKVLSTETGGDGSIATAMYSPASEHISNFAQFTVKTTAGFPDTDQAFAAGYLEGFLTAESIHQHYANMMCQVDCSGYVPPELTEFFAKHAEWTKQQVAAHPDCPYWQYIGKCTSRRLEVPLTK